MARYPIVYIEACESYQKQSWRNRCRILTASGPQDLSFPIVHAPALHCAEAPLELGQPAAPLGLGQSALLHRAEGRLITNIQIEYTTPWVAKTKKALQSAYDSSPFFEYYGPDIFAILDSKPSTLWELNTQIINYLCAKFQIDSKILPTSDYAPTAPEDYRELIHPKRPNNILSQLGLERPYWQVFKQKFGFVGGLSALDLLFCQGPDAPCYLHI